VLRENTNSLLTILSAVVADPLFKWNLTPREAMEIQRERKEDDTTSMEVETESDAAVTAVAAAAMTSDQRNEAALRAIGRIEEKLQGYEDGVSGERQSVEGQVQLLINSARDEENLCRMFFGWAAFA
jgi:phosphatidylinositol kinase/protein kinase (PI-3  family)